MFNSVRRPLTALMLLSSSLLAGCSSQNTPAQIETGPSYAVRYATERVSPAVVQLDVLSENFSQGQSRPWRSLGSGFIIDKEGHILTNFHVAGRATRIEVTLASLEHVRATLIGSDHWTDLALVQLDMDEIHRKGLIFQTATLGRSADVTLGQPVMAVGTPYGLSRTVTYGIISQADRAFEEMTMDDGRETGWFNNWIQTDAAINPGNSGGPLINLRGEVIGINTRGINVGNNLGFAIPIDTAKEVTAELLAHKKVTRSYIGVTLQPLQDLEKFYDLDGKMGVLIASVEKDSPAEAAGLKAEDILLTVNGKPVNARFPEQLAAVRKSISDYAVGTKLELTVRRAGSGAAIARSIPAVTTSPSAAPAGTIPSAPPATLRSEPVRLAVTTDKLESVITDEKAITAWGLSVRDLTRATLRNMRLPKVEGVLVTGVRPGSPADRATIRREDIILRVNDKAVVSTDELQTVVADWEKNPQRIGLDVRRDLGQFPAVIRP